MILPKYIDIELNTNCNLSCQQCPYKEDHKKPEFMTYDILKDIIDQINWKCSLKFCQRGEPLLSALLTEAIRMANKKGLRTIINTNGFYLEHFAEDLIKVGLEALILSDYNHPLQFQHGCTFDAINQFYRSPVDFIVKTTNPKKWNGIAHTIVEPIYYDYLDTTGDSTKLPEWKCSQLWEKLVIDPDGKVRCCCGNIHPQKYVGSVKYQTLTEIWLSLPIKRYRELHYNGLSHKLDMCRKCAYRRSFIKKE